VRLERGPLRLLRMNDEPFERKSKGSTLKRRDQRPYGTAALTTRHPSIRSDHSVGIVSLRTERNGVCLFISESLMTAKLYTSPTCVAHSFDLEAGGIIFLRNVSLLQSVYMGNIPADTGLRSHRRESIKTQKYCVGKKSVNLNHSLVLSRTFTFK
jgi:hypothetical protein